MPADRLPPAGQAPRHAAVKRPVPPKPSVLDVAIYAPIGLASRFRTLVPELVQSGKSQVALLRMIGAGLAGRRGTALPGRTTPSPVAPPPVVSSVPPSPSGPGRSERPGAPGGGSRASGRAPGRASGGASGGARSRAGASSTFPIEGYDTLAASAVVALLPTLGARDRAKVRARELGGRRRRTVLARLDQLDA